MVGPNYLPNDLVEFNIKGLLVIYDKEPYLQGNREFYFDKESAIFDINNRSKRQLEVFIVDGISRIHIESVNNYTQYILYANSSDFMNFNNIQKLVSLLDGCLIPEEDTIATDEEMYFGMKPEMKSLIGTYTLFLLQEVYRFMEFINIDGKFESTEFEEVNRFILDFLRNDN